MTAIRASFLLLIGFCTICISHEANDTMVQGQNLLHWDNLYSPNGMFKLGFTSSGGYHYLGIWLIRGLVYSKPLWVINRDNPVLDSSGILTIDEYGRLKILYIDLSHRPSIMFNSKENTRSVINSTITTTGTLLDSGNFVLTDFNKITGERRVVWQSFDYPTSVLLPGMKLGINFQSGESFSLTSPLSDGVPSSGAFSLGVDLNNTEQLLIWHGGEIYWKSGLWDGRHFSSSPILTSRKASMPFDYSCKFQYISDENGKYFSFSTDINTSILFWVINPKGELEIYEHNKYVSGGGAVVSCENAIAGLSGCSGDMHLACKKSDESFERRIGVMSGLTQYGGMDVGLSECETLCKSICSCVAYAIAKDNETRCNYWISGSKFSAADWGIVIYVLSSHQGNKWKVRIVVSFTVSLAVLVMACLSFMRWRFLKLEGKRDSSQEKLMHELENIHFRDENTIKKGSKKSNQLLMFSFDKIAVATCHFLSTNKLGNGGFGVVYKGKLEDGREIAVKRLSRSSGQGIEEFKNEILLIAKLQYTNLVRLLGCCIQSEEKMLVYEYLPNKSLDYFIFDPFKREILDWKKRSIIIEGIAQGILYLHKYSRLSVIHRDLKASNILLDEEMNPKISDFGMARIFGRNDSEVQNKRIMGTYGYMSPEYAMEGIFSIKSDMFSFGVLLLEIVSGRKNSNFDHDEHYNLISYAWELWREKDIMELMDPILKTSCSKQEVIRCVHVGLLCVQDCATDRPTMLDVVYMFCNISMALPDPKQSAFYQKRGNQIIYSINNVTITCLKAR